MRKKVCLVTVLMVSLCLAADPNTVIFELDATQPGASFWKQWEPTIGIGGGLVGVGANGYTPTLMSEDDGNGNYTWFYHFEAQTDGSAAGTSGGYATGYGIAAVGDLKLDPRQNYTIEAWIRRPGLVGMSGGWAESIIGNYNRGLGNGWAMMMYGLGTTHTYARPYARARDNMGTDKVDQKIRGNSYNYATDPTLWHHIVITWKGADPAGLVEGKTYFDGVNNFADYDTAASPTAIASTYWESDNVDVFGGDEVRVGVAYNDTVVADQLWYRGDIAMIRIYNGVLSDTAVADNYAAGLPTATEASPTVICSGDIEGDLNADCQVDFEDFATMAFNWLTCNLDPATACFN